MEWMTLAISLLKLGTDIASTMHQKKELSVEEEAEFQKRWDDMVTNSPWWQENPYPTDDNKNV